MTYLSNNLSHKKYLSQLKIPKLFTILTYVQKKPRKSYLSTNLDLSLHYFWLNFKPPATMHKFLLTDLSPFQHKCPIDVCLDVLGKERHLKIYIYDDSELLERYRFNSNKILYITDLSRKDLCPLTGMSQSIDAVTKVLLTLWYFVHHRL